MPQIDLPSLHRMQYALQFHVHVVMRYDAHLEIDALIQQAFNNVLRRFEEGGLGLGKGSLWGEGVVGADDYGGEAGDLLGWGCRWWCGC